MARNIIAALDDLASELESQGLKEAAMLLDSAANTLEQDGFLEASGKTDETPLTTEQEEFVSDILTEKLANSLKAEGLEEEDLAKIENDLQGILKESLVSEFQKVMADNAGKEVPISQLVVEDSIRRNLQVVLDKAVAGKYSVTGTKPLKND